VGISDGVSVFKLGLDGTVHLAVEVDHPRVIRVRWERETFGGLTEIKFANFRSKSRDPRGGDNRPH
jgi:hypothetical protein